MDVAFKDESLDRLEIDPTYSGRYGSDVVKAYRKAMQHIRAATDERTLYNRRGFRFEKLSGNREGQCSLRLNKQWRLIVEITGTAPNKVVNVLEIADYH
ncbi:MAG TPA: type II toxin-antitoxin system RelE/ParE family toxin [Pseudolabrys sp.]|nr:type II toxin-antitoxin system RelE/ParE family toxin [Pseudolabrys sp.]